MNNSEIKSMITSTIKPNGKGEITGQRLQDVLIAMVNVLGDGYAYKGDATPLTDPKIPDNKVFYLAVEAGTYTNFDNIVVSEPTILYFDTEWHSRSLNGNFPTVAHVSDILNGNIIPKLAENLSSWKDNDLLPVDNDFNDTIRTTAGDDPIDTAAGGVLLAIKAVSDFKCTGLLATSENQLRLRSNGGGAVAVGAGWYFPVPTLTYGGFGTADENNGLILVANDGSNIQNATVYFKALANGVPTGITDGIKVIGEEIIYNGKSYTVYTTSGPGYLIVSDITYENTCARIAWEDWYDKFVSPTAQDDLGGGIDLSALFAAAPNGTGKFLVCGGSSTHAERINAGQWRIIDPIGRIASPVWTDAQDEVKEGGTQTYTHSLNVPGIDNNGIAIIEGSSQSLSIDGTVVSYTDTNATAISGAVRYILDSPVTAVVNLASDYTLNDVGVEMKEGSEGEAIFTCQYSQNIADSLALGAQKLNDLRVDAASISLGYGLCTTGTYIKDKVVTIPNFVLLRNGVINVLFTTPINTEHSTLNVSLTGAKPIRILGQDLPAGAVKAQSYATLAYDGEVWNIVNLFHPDSSFDPAGLVIDMGLSNGVKWAARDIDLTKPGGFCDTPFVYEKSFFSWGNIDGHNPINNSFRGVYNWGSINSQEPWYDGQVYGNTKGATLVSSITTDEEFDAARANLGSPWRMPTTTEFKELFDNCIYIDASGAEVSADTVDKRVTVNGIAGLYLQSKINGNRLFFACSGLGNGASWNYRGSLGNYWSASFNSARFAGYLSFDSSGVFPQNNYYRYYGFAVRPVQ